MKREHPEISAFTEKTQKNYHSPLDSANNWWYNIVKDKERGYEKEPGSESKLNNRHFRYL